MPPQPGARQEPRVVSLLGTAQPLDFVLEPGLPLLEAVARPLRLAGFTSAVLELSGGGFDPFSYVLPAAAADETHAAWYSAPRTPPQGAQLERGCVTFGQRLGRDGPEDWVHCHGVWQEAAGRCGGHILPEESRVAAPITARAWGLGGMGFRVAADPETNFALFAPIPNRCGQAGQGYRASHPPGRGSAEGACGGVPAARLQAAPSCEAASAAWMAPASPPAARCPIMPRSFW